MQRRFIATPKRSDYLANINKRARQKISRIKTRYGVSVDIDVNKSFSTLKEYNAYVKKIESFLDRKNPDYSFSKNEYGVVFTKREIQQAKEIVNKTNKALSKRNKKLKNKKSSNEPSRMVDTRNSAIKKVKFNKNNFTSKEGFKRFLSNTKKKGTKKYSDEKLKQFKRNYIKSLNDVFGEMSRNIVNKIKKMNDIDFYNTYMENENSASFDFIYLFLDVMTKLNQLNEVWQ